MAKFIVTVKMEVEVEANDHEGAWRKIREGIDCRDLEAGDFDYSVRTAGFRGLGTRLNDWIAGLPEGPEDEVT